MNIFNRILVVLLLLLLLAVAVLVAVLPGQTALAVEGAMRNFNAFLANAEKSYFWLYVVARVALVLVALGIVLPLLWGELKPRRPRAVHVLTETGSKASVTTDSVARRLTWHIDQLADVISVTPSVTAAGKAVNVVLNLETQPEIDVPMKTDEVVRVTREVIVDRMGLQLGKVDVRIKHAPYQDVA